MAFCCKSCGFLNEIEPEHNKKQEEIAVKLLTEIKEKLEKHNRVKKECEEATEKWKLVSGWKKILNRLNMGDSFETFLKTNYPELYKLSKNKMVLIWHFDNSATPSASLLPDIKYLDELWNYSYICQNCDYLNKYWEGIK